MVTKFRHGDVACGGTKSNQLVERVATIDNDCRGDGAWARRQPLFSFSPLHAFSMQLMVALHSGRDVGQPDAQRAGSTSLRNRR